MPCCNQRLAIDKSCDAVGPGQPGCHGDPQRESASQCTAHCCLAAAISQTIPALVSVYDYQLDQLVWTNDRFSQFFGVGASPGRPLAIQQLAAQLHPDDIARIQGKFDALGSVSMGTEVSVEVRLFDRSGACRWVKCHDTVIEVDRENRPLRALGIAFDITERRGMETALRASEEMFRRTAEHMSDGFYILDRTGEKFLFLNESIKRLTGLGVGALMEGGTSMCLDMVDPRDHPRVERWFADCIASADPARVTELEYRQRHVDGSTRWVSDRIFPITDETGQIVRFGGICTDITDRKRAERRLKRRDRVLKKLIRRRTHRVRDLVRQRAEQDRHVATGRIAARIAHEINNPLAGVKNAFRLVRDAVPGDPPHHHFAAKIESEIEHIAKIVRQMYTLYRPEAEQPRPIDVGALVRDLVVVLAPRLEQHQIDIRYRPVLADCSIMAPESGLREILLNLTANAVEASPPGSTVTISCQLSDGFYRLSVVDHGCGIAPEHQDHVFEPFFTTKRSHDGAGMGLGLSVTQSLVLAMKGTISFTSSPGVGTTFTVCIPQNFKEESP